MNEASLQGTRTRDRILATAVRLFSEKGFDHTPLSHVAREAKVSKALILWHFESKADLFRAALSRTLEPYHIDVASLAGLDERAKVERLIDLYFEFVADNRYSVRFIVDLMVRESGPDEVLSHVNELYALFRDLLIDTIAGGCDSRQFRANLRPELEAALILTTLDGILIERFLDETRRPTSPEDLLEHLKATTLQRLLR